jgi:hypothetical protein
VFVGIEDLLVVEDELVDEAEREVEEVDATATRSPKLYHEAVSPKPAVFVVYTVCRVAAAVQPKPENWKLPSHIRVAQKSEPGTALPAISSAPFSAAIGSEMNAPLHNKRITLAIAIARCAGSYTGCWKRHVGALSSRATLVNTVEGVNSTSVAWVANIR